MSECRCGSSLVTSRRLPSTLPSAASSSATQTPCSSATPSRQRQPHSEYLTSLPRYASSVSLSPARLLPQSAADLVVQLTYTESWISVLYHRVLCCSPQLWYSDASPASLGQTARFWRLPTTNKQRSFHYCCRLGKQGGSPREQAHIMRLPSARQGSWDDCPGCLAI